MKKTLIFVGFLLVGCGAEAPVSDDKDPIVIPKPGDGDGDGGDSKTSFAQVSEIHQQYCIQCHANSGFIRSETALKNSSAKQRVQNKSMPPSSASVKMPDSVREIYLNFFTG